MKVYFVLLLFLASMLMLGGCYHNTTSPLPKDLFLQVKRLEKPTIENLEDIQKSYIKLFEAYELNLNLLETIEKVN